MMPGSHGRNGLIFIGACAAIGMLIFAVDRASETIPIVPQPSPTVATAVPAYGTEAAYERLPAADEEPAPGRELLEGDGQFEHLSGAERPAIPDQVRALIAREEVENEACRGGSGDPESLRACNRRQALLQQLQTQGWCWGGADVEAQKRFIRCKPGDRDYDEGAFDAPYYTEEEIGEAADTAAKQDPL